MQTKTIIKYCFALVLNIAPFLLCTLLYPNGAYIIVCLYPIFQIFLTVLNYVWTKEIPTFLLLNITMLIASVLGNNIHTSLYYNNISSDSETLLVGGFLTMLAVSFAILLSVIGIIIRMICKRKSRKQHTDETV